MSTEADTHPATSLRFRLRAATDALHRETERRFALDRRISAPGPYRDLLAVLYGFHAPLEHALSRIDWSGSRGMAQRLCKADWLAADLIALGLAPADISALPRCADLPALNSRAAGLGALYVVEGATLGGQLIQRDLRQRLDISPDHGGRFFSSYGDRIGAMWRLFVAELDAFRGDTALVERTAGETFQVFGDWLPAVHHV